MTVEYHWLEGQYDLPALMADVVRRRVAVIATPGNAPSLAAKAATCNGGQRRRARLVKTDAPAPARVFRFNDPQAA